MQVVSCVLALSYWGWSWDSIWCLAEICVMWAPCSMPVTWLPCVLIGGSVDLDGQAEGKKEVEANDEMRSGPRPIVPYSSMFCLSPTNL